MDERMMDGNKLMWHHDRLNQWYVSNERVPPVHLDIGITKCCNAKCVYCYGQYQQMTGAIIPREALLGIIRDAAEIGVRSIAIIGDGEPTLNPAYYDAMCLGKELGLDVATSTNGILVDSMIKAYHILCSCLWARINISAGTAEGYKRIHGVDKFKIVRHNIERLAAINTTHNIGCDFGLQAVYIPGQMDDEMVELSKMAVSLGVNYLVIKQCSLPDRGESGMAQFDVADYLSNKTCETLQKCEEFSNSSTKIICKRTTMAAKGVRIYKGCPAVPLISEISGDGSWYPCGYFFGRKKEYEHLRIADLTTTRFKEAYNSDRYLQVLRAMYEYDTQGGCHGACRLDRCNEYVYQYLNPPKAKNFI